MTAVILKNPEQDQPGSRKVSPPLSFHSYLFPYYKNYHQKLDTQQRNVCNIQLNT
jgi:hypothetical protein